MRNQFASLGSAKHVKILSGEYKAEASFEKEINDSISQGWRIVEIIQVSNGDGEGYAQVFLIKPATENKLVV